MNKKAQVTIFIIIAIMIVVLVALYFLFRESIGINITDTTSEENPGTYLENCLEDSVRDVIEILSLQGGSLEPQLNISFRFNGENKKEIRYLCYNQNYYSPCVNQEPLLINTLQDEIKNEITLDVRACFDSLGKSLDDAGYVVDSTPMRNFEVTLMPNKIDINIDAEIILTKAGKRTTQDEFHAYIPTQLYGLTNVAQEIISQQARFCSFNELGYMLTYPDWSISELMTGDSTIIYSLEHRKSHEKFRFAVRGCVIPPGF